MSNGGLILTYHAVEHGPAPLCIDPELFRVHLDCVVEAGLDVLTIESLAARLRSGDLPERWVALTFDDGFASVSRTATPLLVERGLVATVFCVAGYLGGRNDWPTQPASAPRLPLAAAPELADLARLGFEIGSHGMSHEPLDVAGDAAVRREVIDSKESLEETLGVPVSSFAYPYGAGPSAYCDRLVAETYSGACTSRIWQVSGTSDPLALARVDAHYLRRPSVLRRALGGGIRPYLAARRVAAGARRAVRSDFAGRAPV